MPYKRIGNVIYSKSTGKWRRKQKAKNPKNAKKAMNLLRGIEHGWHPTKKKKRR